MAIVQRFGATVGGGDDLGHARLPPEIYDSASVVRTSPRSHVHDNFLRSSTDARDTLRAGPQLTDAGT